jgi:oligosaccharide reducing-end xylanase
MALDEDWSMSGPLSVERWNVQEANRILTFFTSLGPNYGTSYTLDGTPVKPAPETALVAVNGVSAMIATKIDRSNYVNQVWGMITATGLPRYYEGILQLTALLILGGRYQVL